MGEKNIFQKIFTKRWTFCLSRWLPIERLLKIFWENLKFFLIKWNFRVSLTVIYGGYKKIFMCLWKSFWRYIDDKIKQFGDKQNAKLQTIKTALTGKVNESKSQAKWCILIKKESRIKKTHQSAFSV